MCRSPAHFVLNLPSKYWLRIKSQIVGFSPQFKHIYSFVYGNNKYVVFRNYLENLLRDLISCYTEVWLILSLVSTRGEGEQQIPVPASQFGTESVDIDLNEIPYHVFRC